MVISVYAPLNKEVWRDTLPMGWDKVQDMYSYLKKHNWSYQMLFELNIVASSLTPKHRCTLIRWESGALVGQKREVVLQTTEPQQMEAALFMLINEAEQENKHGKQVQV